VFFQQALLTSGIWKDYAARYLTPQQIDTVDVPALLAAAGVFTGSKDYCYSNLPVSGVTGP